MYFAITSLSFFFYHQVFLSCSAERLRPLLKPCSWLATVTWSNELHLQLNRKRSLLPALKLGRPGRWPHRPPRAVPPCLPGSKKFTCAQACRDSHGTLLYFCSLVSGSTKPNVCLDDTQDNVRYTSAGQTHTHNLCLSLLETNWTAMMYLHVQSCCA